MARILSHPTIPKSYEDMIIDHNYCTEENNDWAEETRDFTVEEFEEKPKLLEEVEQILLEEPETMFSEEPEPMLSEEPVPMLAEQTELMLAEQTEPMLAEQTEPQKPDKDWNGMITEAIMTSESQALTLDAICKSIKETYPYFDSKAYKKRGQSHKFRLQVQYKLCEGILFCQVPSSDSLMWAMKDDKEALNPPTKGPSTTSTYSVKNGVYSCNQCDMKTPSAHK